MIVSRGSVAAAFACGLGTASFAVVPTARAEARHEYPNFETLIRKNVSQFHVTFNAHDFEKNGELVANNLSVNSNGVKLQGREAFIKRIARFVGPFPDVAIRDLVTIVDGNKAAVRYVLTGTQDGDLETPEGLLRATHKRISVDGAEFFTFDERGKLIDLVTIERLDQLMQQLKH